MNASDQLNDLMTIRQLLLGRVIAGENIKLNNHLNDVAARLEAQLRSGKEFTSYQGRRLQQAIGDLAGLVQLQRPDLADLASMEAKFAQGAVGKVGIDIALPPKKVLQSVADTALVQGATFGDWFSKLEGSMRFDIDRAVKVGVSLGETNAQIAKRILGAGGDKGGEVMPRGRRDAMAITRTAVQTIANEARLATYLENADIIKAVQWISTLDSRTTLICMARSGKTWTIPEFQPIGHKIPWGGGPPAHWACRSTTIPVTKSFEELGGAGPDLSPTTRSSMDGQVAADLTFDNFLKGKPPGFADEMLGVGRADLWRAGKITLSDLLDARGVPLTLAQLNAQYGAATVVVKVAEEAAMAAAAEVLFDMATEVGQWHQASFGGAADTIAKQVAASIQDITVKRTDKGAYASADRLINMDKAYDIASPLRQTTWRHEFGHIFDYRAGKGRNGYYRSASREFKLAREADRDSLLLATGCGRVSKATTARVEQLRASYEEATQFAIDAGRDDFRKAAKAAGLDFDAFEGVLRDSTNLLENGGYDSLNNRVRISKMMNAFKQGDPEEFINAAAKFGTDYQTANAVLNKDGIFGYFADMIGSATNNKVAGYESGFFGHSKTYYKSHGNEVESYANLMTAFSHKNPYWMTIFERFAPQMSAEFKKDIEEWMKTQPSK
ncbi:Phage head morphogenesis domain containing protein [uncultured Caudovirales phage]|uniref:Phage head morphogenesis domain containing protein n=1 Tax=uncultured Caudovirales phage TaxID=2100421 RepID=A0A6J7WAM8_9CAUD|nr:Phage head morphogenesis domain containing protein [uncultured Caudovirales phage]